MKKPKPRLQFTRNYDLFIMHEFNRDLHKSPLLEESIKKHGFMPSHPIQCISNGNGKLKVIDGHHRLYYGKRLDTGIWYVVDNSTIEPMYLQGDSRQRWSVLDFATAYAKAGYKDYAKLLTFRKKYNLPLVPAASLVYGQSAGSNNAVGTIKRGLFRCGKMDHAMQVVQITELCRELQMDFATSTAFVNAISLVLQVEEFSIDMFCHKLRIRPRNIMKRGRKEEYLEEIEALYNRGNRKMLPLKIKAIEAAKERARTFGRRNSKE